MVVVRYEAGREGYRLLPSPSPSKGRRVTSSPPTPLAPLPPILPAYLGLEEQGEELRVGIRGREDSRFINSQPEISQLGLRLFQTSSKEITLGEVSRTGKPRTRVESGRGKLQLVRHQRLPQAAYQTNF